MVLGSPYMHISISSTRANYALGVKLGVGVAGTDDIEVARERGRDAVVRRHPVPRSGFAAAVGDDVRAVPL